MWQQIKEKLSSLRPAMKKPSSWLLPALAVLGLVLCLAGSGLFGGNATPEATADTQDLRHTMEEEARRLCEMVEGAGDCVVRITFESGESYTYSGTHLTSTTPPTVLGVAVVAEGGNSDRVRRELTELLCALYHVGANRVHISPMD